MICDKSKTFRLMSQGSEWVKKQGFRFGDIVFHYDKYIVVNFIPNGKDKQVNCVSGESCINEFIFNSELLYIPTAGKMIRELGERLVALYFNDEPFDDMKARYQVSVYIKGKLKLIYNFTTPEQALLSALEYKESGRTWNNEKEEWE